MLFITLRHVDHLTVSTLGFNTLLRAVPMDRMRLCEHMAILGAPFGEQAACKSACSEEISFIRQRLPWKNAYKTAGSVEKKALYKG